MPTALGRPRRLAGEPSSRHASSFPPHPSILPPPRTPPTSLDPAARRDALNVGRQLLKIETALDARLAAARPSSAGKRFPGDLLEPLGGPAPPSLAAAAADAAAPAPAAAAAAADALRRRPSGKPRVIRVLSLPSLPTAALGLSPLPPAPPPAAAAVSEAWAAAPPTAYPTAEEEAAAEAAEAAEWELYRCCFRVLRAWRREASSAALARTKAALLHRIWLGLLRLRVYRAWRSLVTLRASLAARAATVAAALATLGARRALRRWSSRTLSAARCSQMERSFAFASLRAKVRRSPPRAIRRNLLTHPRVAAGGAAARLAHPVRVRAVPRPRPPPLHLVPPPTRVARAAAPALGTGAEGRSGRAAARESSVEGGAAAPGEPAAARAAAAVVAARVGRERDAAPQEAMGGAARLAPCSQNVSPPPLPPPARPRRATMTAPHPGAPRPRRRRLGQWTAFVLHDIADEDDEGRCPRMTPSTGTRCSSS